MYDFIAEKNLNNNKSILNKNKAVDCKIFNNNILIHFLKTINLWILKFYAVFF